MLSLKHVFSYSIHDICCASAWEYF